MTTSPTDAMRACTLNHEERAKHEAEREAKIHNAWRAFSRTTASANAEEKRAYASFRAAEAEWHRALAEYDRACASARIERTRAESEAWDELKQALEEPEGGR
jgi:hypothetical protein